MTTDRTPKLADFHELAIHQLHLLARASERAAEAELDSGFGVTLLESRIIGLIASAGALPFKRLTTYGRFDKSHASRLVATLVRKGAVTVEADPKDQRATILRLTGKGERLFRGVYAIAAKRNAAWLDALPQQDREGFKRSLNTLIQLEGSPSPDKVDA